MIKSEDIMITMEHVRKAKMCSGGSRAFFRKHNLDWNKFLTEGLPASVILATGDSMAEHVVEVAYGRL
jgi:hypothetical protein